MTERIAAIVLFNSKARCRYAQRSAWSLWCELKPHLTDDQAERLKTAWWHFTDGGEGATELDAVCTDIKMEWSR